MEVVLNAVEVLTVEEVLNVIEFVPKVEEMLKVLGSCAQAAKVIFRSSRLFTQNARRPFAFARPLPTHLVITGTPANISGLALRQGQLRLAESQQLLAAAFRGS